MRLMSFNKKSVAIVIDEYVTHVGCRPFKLTRTEHYKICSRAHDARIKLFFLMMHEESRALRGSVVCEINHFVDEIVD